MMDTWRWAGRGAVAGILVIGTVVLTGCSKGPTPESIKSFPAAAGQVLGQALAGDLDEGAHVLVIGRWDPSVARHPLAHAFADALDRSPDVAVRIPVEVEHAGGTLALAERERRDVAVVVERQPSDVPQREPPVVHFEHGGDLILKEAVLGAVPGETQADHLGYAARRDDPDAPFTVAVQAVAPVGDQAVGRS